MRKLFVFVFLFVFNEPVSFGQTATPSHTPLPSPATLEAEKRRPDHLQSRYNDYANYKRYDDAYSKPLLPAKDEARVIFIGDSITDGQDRRDLKQ